MKALVPALTALLLAGSALAQEPEPSPPAGGAGAASEGTDAEESEAAPAEPVGAAAEGTDTEEPVETGETAPSQPAVGQTEPTVAEAAPEPPTVEPSPPSAAALPPPPTSYNPSGAYAPTSPAPTAAYAPPPAGADIRLPPTSFNPSGAYLPSSPTLDPQTRLPPTSYNPSGAYAPRSYYPPSDWPQSSAPVFIDQAGRSAGPPLGYADSAYEARLRASFLAAQGMKGPLEGGWVIAAQDGGRLYDLQLVDAGYGGVEGAWRDLRRPGALDSSGLIVGAQRVGNQFTLRFYPPGARDAVSVNLTAGYDGRWSGELTEAGQRRNVTLQRQ